MALSMSVSAGAHNARHNTDLAYRANLRNVDADLSVGNISIRDVPIAEALAAFHVPHNLGLLPLRSFL